MSQIAASYYDGLSARKVDVIVHFTLPDTVRVTGLPGPRTERLYSLPELKISERIGGSARSIYLPGGGKCEADGADANDAIDQFLKSAGHKSFEGRVHLIESKFAYAIAALIITAVSLWAFVEYGIPELSKRAAFAMPSSISGSLDSEGLDLMDRILFDPSELDDDTKRRFTKLFAEMSHNLKNGPELWIEFRRGGGVGANAFALPSGTIVFTDELINMSKDDKEIIAIMAHEAGHVAGRHTLRMILQNSTVALLISTITGDLTSITALSSAIPTMLVQSKYSRRFETEADSYALEYMRQAGIERIHFANILERMSAEKRMGDDDNDMVNYLSSHPATKERVERFK